MPRRKNKSEIDITPWLPPGRLPKGRRQELRRWLEAMPVVSYRSERCWTLLARRKNFFIKLQAGGYTIIAFVDRGGWATFAGQRDSVHASRLVVAERPASIML